MTDSILKRRENENEFERKVRVCLAKLNKETDLDWIEIRDGLNLEHSFDHLRKLAYGFKEMIDNGYGDRLENMEDEEVLNELELKKIELMEERKKLQSIRVEYNKTAREKSRRELMFESLRDGFEKLDAPDPLPTYDTTEKEKKHVLSFGDIHFGKEFESFSNTYNEEIAMRRMNEIITKTVAYAKKHHIREIDVVNGADNVEGLTLRVSQLKSLESGFVDQVIKFSKFYAKWLNELSKHLIINVHQISSANHSEIRPFNSSRGEFPEEDMERIIAMYVQDVLANNPNITINIYEGGIADFKLFDFNFISLHGHQMKGNKNLIKDFSHHRRKFYDYAIIFHFHHGNGLTVASTGESNVQVIQVPSVMGSDPYSDTLLTGSMPGALITTFTKDEGKTDTHEIILN